MHFLSPKGRSRQSQRPPSKMAESTYSPLIAFIYVFNLVVGTGALALPSVLITGGWYLGILFLIVVACQSFIGVTFVIESMAAANAIVYLEATKDTEKPKESESDAFLRAESSAGSGLENPVQSPFEIVKRMEFGQMAQLFFPRWGQVFFYIALISYLFGDAAIYCTFVPRSLVGFVYGQNSPPWAFDAFLLLFVLLIVPFSFFDFQKTKLLQMTTMAIRNGALFTIIFLAIKSAVREGPQTKGVPKFAPNALPNLFGGAVYAFMCHHSLPGIITPMRQKSQILRVLTSAFVGILALYFLLFLSCGVAFGLKAQDPITFNFPPKKFGWVGDGLLLFPVFTLSSSFPMLSITLRNNLDHLFSLIIQQGPNKHREHPVDSVVGDIPFWESQVPRRILMTLLAVGPPILTCLIAEHQNMDVNSLVGITGGYAGAAVMLIIPACLVYCSRRLIAQEYRSRGEEVSSSEPNPNKSHPLNIHASPFKGTIWVVFLIVAAIFTISFISLEKLIAL